MNTPPGVFNSAAVAAPPSPVWPAVPLPAMVDMIPELVTIRIRLLVLSAIYMLPDVSTATSVGSLISDDVALIHRHYNLLCHYRLLSILFHRQLLYVYGYYPLLPCIYSPHYQWPYHQG